MLDLQSRAVAVVVAAVVAELVAVTASEAGAAARRRQRKQRQWLAETLAVIVVETERQERCQWQKERHQQWIAVAIVCDNDKHKLG